MSVAFAAWGFPAVAGSPLISGDVLQHFGQGQRRPSPGN